MSLTVFIPKIPKLQSRSCDKFVLQLHLFCFFSLGVCISHTADSLKKKVCTSMKRTLWKQMSFQAHFILKRYKSQRKLKSWFQYFISAVSPSSPQESAQLLKISSASVERQHQITWKNYRTPTPSTVWVFTYVNFFLNPYSEFDNAVRHIVCSSPATLLKHVHHLTYVLWKVWSYHHPVYSHDPNLKSESFMPSSSDQNCNKLSSLIRLHCIFKWFLTTDGDDHMPWSEAIWSR